MASPFPFTSGQVLTAAQLNSIGEATAFTPSWGAALTVGNATESWHYLQVNEWLYFAGATTLGSTSSVTGFFSFDFPIGTQLTAAFVPAGFADYLSVSTGQVFRGSIDQNGDNIRFFVNQVSGSNVIKTPTSATLPLSWATGDIIRASGAVLLA